MKISHLATAVCVIATLAVVSASAAARATTSCKAVSGHYTSSQTTAGCLSPTGICFTGTITGGDDDQLLDGAATFIELDQAPAAGMPLTEPGTTVSYSGTVTITTGAGQLVVRDLGVIDGARTVFTEMERPVGGTGIFVNASSTFFISGTMNSTLTTFDGQVSGQLCGVATGD